MDVVGAVIGISVAPFALLLLVPDLNKHRQLLKILLAFAAGGLLGDAFLHLIPHALSNHADDNYSHDLRDHSHSLSDSNSRVFLCVIGGIFGFLCIDKTLRFLCGRHGHSHAAPQAEKSDKKMKNGKFSENKISYSAKNNSKRAKGLYIPS